MLSLLDVEPSTLTTEHTLADLETVIERGQQTFIEVGNALLEIRDRGLYKESGYTTFADYCERRHGIRLSQAYNYINAAQAAPIFQLTGKSQPSLTQAVELAPLPVEQQQEIARRVDFSQTTVRELKVIVQEVKDMPPSPRMAVHYSSETPEWYTPPEIVERTVRLFGQIDLDPCSNRGTPNIPATYHYTVDDDGLHLGWYGRVYCNPPYGREIADWMQKLIAEQAAGHVTEFIALVPARTDTDWFRLLRDCAICFIDGRLHFSGHETGAPFPSAVIYSGKRLDGFSEAFADMGDIWVRWARDNGAES